MTCSTPCSRHQPDDPRSGAPRLALSAAVLLSLQPALTPTLAADPRVAVPDAADGQMNARVLSLGVCKIGGDRPAA
ncbi:MAG: hypothetical protein MZV49_21460 [Rhodopseudomonas palustris]|nr:hypothetical protein [Rhodopseudomonas palustris]